MWSEGLDRIVSDVVREEGVDWRQLRAISGSAQQHGSVYLNAKAGSRIAALDASRPLAPQVSDIFSRATSPIWMDSSTTRQCGEIEAALGGPRELARLTGSRAFERFTGPQIRKFAQESPDGYAATERIHLVSSWLASLLAGAHAAIDPGDGSGMNLMDLGSRQWSQAALRATASGLDAKLPDIAEAWTPVGTLAPYWQQRYSLPPARVIAWSGDNPCSLVGTGLVRAGVVAISARATRSSASCRRRNRAATARAMCSPHPLALTWECRFSRTGRWRANGCATVTGWTGPLSRTHSRRQVPAIAAPSCCRGSILHYAARTRSQAYGASISTRTMARPTFGLSSRRR